MVRRLVAFAAVVALVGCGKTPSTEGAPPPPSSGVTTGVTPAPTKAPEPYQPQPRCATQDCKTKAIVDDGCVDDIKGGRLCAACVIACPPP